MFYSLLAWTRFWTNGHVASKMRCLILTSHHCNENYVGGAPKELPNHYQIPGDLANWQSNPSTRQVGLIFGGQNKMVIDCRQQIFMKSRLNMLLYVIIDKTCHTNELILVQLTENQVIEFMPWHWWSDRPECIMIKLSDAYMCMHH